MHAINSNVTLYDNFYEREDFFIYDLVKQHATNKPNEEAVRSGENFLTWKQLDERSTIVAKCLSNILNLESMTNPNDTCVAVMSDNSVAYMELLVANTKAGVPVLCLNPLYNSKEVVAIVNNSQAAVLFLEKKFQKIINDNRPEFLFVKHFIYFDEDIDDDDDDAVVVAGDMACAANGGCLKTTTVYSKFCQIQEEKQKGSYCHLGQSNHLQANAFVVCTSGTTSLPKLTLITHSMLSSTGNHVKYFPKTTANSGQFCITNFAGIVALMVLSEAIYQGFCTVLVDQKSDIPKFCQMVNAWTDPKLKIGNGFIFGDQLKWIVEHYEKNPRLFDGHKIANFFYGGMKLPTQLLLRLMKLFPDTNISQIYGSTEMIGALWMNNADHRSQSKAFLNGAAGKILPNCEGRIVDPSTGKVLGVNEVGELQIKSKKNTILTNGYLNNKESTQKAMDSDGWYFTGDGAKIDEDGYVYIIDRLKEMIILPDARNVYASEIEQTLSKHKDIKEICCFGIPREDKIGEYITTAIILDDHLDFPKEQKGQLLTPENLEEPQYHDVLHSVFDHCAQELSSYKVPHKIVIVDDFERSKNFKILKREMKVKYSLLL